MVDLLLQPLDAGCELVDSLPGLLENLDVVQREGGGVCSGCLRLDRATVIHGDKG